MQLMTIVTFFIDSTAQKMKFSIEDFFSKCDQTCSLLRIWSHLLEKSLMENFIFCVGKLECPQSRDLMYLLFYRLFENLYKTVAKDNKPPANDYKLSASDHKLRENNQKRPPQHIKPKSWCIVSSYRTCQLQGPAQFF